MGGAVASAVAVRPRATPGRRTLAALGLAVLLLAPLALLSDYQLFRLTLVAAYAVAVLGLNLVMGYGGQISLGHGAFYAVGAYATAILMATWDVPYWATLPVSAATCAGLGFLVGWPALRLSGPYLALVTLALATAVPQILKIKALDPWTGGVQGVVISKPDAPFGLPLSRTSGSTSSRSRSRRLRSSPSPT